jgi:N-acetylmuramic acid 6-phosphate etherase
VQKEVGEKDVVCGLAASGRTPYVAGALSEAKKRGAFTVLITAVAKEKLTSVADLIISLNVGPEVVMGSTRLKSATAQKMVLNMITTGAMILNGKVYQNVMVDLQATNQKLRERSIRTLLYFLPLSYEEAGELLKKAGGHVKTALLMQMRSLNRGDAQRKLELCDGHLEKALQD